MRKKSIDGLQRLKTIQEWKINLYLKKKKALPSLPPDHAGYCEGFMLIKELQQSALSSLLVS